MKITVILPALLVLIALLIASIGIYIWAEFFSFDKNWSTLQQITTTDQRHVATLQRNHHYVDLNFRILLGKKEIYRSPDFDPSDDRPLTERITWAKGEQCVVFMSSNRIIFAYNVLTRKRLREEDYSDVLSPISSLSGGETNTQKP